MSTTVPINSDGWTLTTFFGGTERGRCYELHTTPGGMSSVVTEKQLLAFFDSKHEENQETQEERIDRLHGPGAAAALDEAIANGAVFSASSR